MMILKIFFLVTFFDVIFAQYQDVSNNIALGQTMTWTHTPTMGSMRIKLISPPDTIIEATCDITLTCGNHVLTISRSGLLDLNLDGQNYCGTKTLPLTRSIGNEIVFALYEYYSNSGANFRCVFKAVAQTDANCECGWRKSARIVGGSAASSNEFVPHTAFVYSSQSQNEIFCGGTILSQYHILTAAHCTKVYPVGNVRALVGDHDTSRSDDTPWAAIYNLASWTPHASFNSDLSLNDIAIARTATYIRYNLGVGPACLPYTYNGNSFVNSYLNAVGWGATEFGGPTSNILKKVSLKALANTECATKMPNNKIDVTKICTYNGISAGDSCQKDSGGGLYYAANNRQFTIAVINYGIGCAGKYPSVNTRLDRYFGWIQTVTGRSFFCRK